MTTVNFALNVPALSAKYGPETTSELYAAVLVLNYQSTKRTLETTGNVKKRSQQTFASQFFVLLLL
jgi:hypothetical protein